MEYPGQKPSLFQAFIPLTFLIALLTINIFVFDVDATSGPNQLALIFSAMVAALVGLSLKISWKKMEEGIVSHIIAAVPAILVLLLIGALAGTWMISGIVPAMIYYGLKILSPTIFLFATCIICAVVSVATGSSWTTVATVGIALLGVGQALGFSEGLIAGGIISGAYFGDKLSPLSDTTNLSAAMAETDLFRHIRYMLYTTVPSISIALILYLLIGFSANDEVNTQTVNGVLNTLDETFDLNPLLFLAPVLVIFLIIKKVPAFPALLIGALLGGVFAIVFQKDIILQVAGSNELTIQAVYVAVMRALYTSVEIQTGNPLVNNLLSSSGMEGMLNTIWLIITAMIFGGIMENSGLLVRITESIVALAKTTASLISATVGTCIFFNLTASDQYLSIIVPGKMFKKPYQNQGLKPENLSRTLEDSGTVTSVLIPWNTCGATQSAVLGVATLAYLPFCFFNILSPFMSILFASLNLKVARNSNL